MDTKMPSWQWAAFGIPVIVLLLTLAQRLTQFIHRTVGRFCGVAAGTVAVGLGFLYLPVEIASIVLVLAWSLLLWFLFGWVRDSRTQKTNRSVADLEATIGKLKQAHHREVSVRDESIEALSAQVGKFSAAIQEAEAERIEHERAKAQFLGTLEGCRPAYKSVGVLGLLESEAEELKARIAALMHNRSDHPPERYPDYLRYPLQDRYWAGDVLWNWERVHVWCLRIDMARYCATCSAVIPGINTDLMSAEPYTKIEDLPAILYRHQQNLLERATKLVESVSVEK